MSTYFLTLQVKVQFLWGSRMHKGKTWRLPEGDQEQRSTETFGICPQQSQSLRADCDREPCVLAAGSLPSSVDLKICPVT